MPPSALAKRCLFLVLRTGFRLLPLPARTRDRLRQRFLDRYAHVVPAGPRGQPVDGAAERRPRRHAAGRAIGFVAHRSEPLPTPLPATLVAFYLPQFHPIPQNDAWWGEGFTEWSNVARALPQFEGHAQPRLPGALGFYDLRLPAVMRQQMQLAREYGIGAFCTYFYWFGGERLLEQPLLQWLDDPSLDLPMCLCWANENWSRRWDGRADDVLIGQRHSTEDDLAFIAYVARYLRDPRYLRVQGKPLLLVYRPGLLPDPAATASRWRHWCREQGIGEIQLAYVQSFDRVEPGKIGFDAAVEFPPNNTTLAPITGRQRLTNPAFRGDVYDWRDLARAAADQAPPTYLRYPGVNPGWDNEPRRSGRDRVFAHASPRGYRDWLRCAIDMARSRQPEQPLVFINAWNEWAEGAVLEPDVRLGHAWLQATRDALHGVPARNKGATRPCAVVHAPEAGALDSVIVALLATGIDWRLVVTTTSDQARAVRERMSALIPQWQWDVLESPADEMFAFLQVANKLLDEGVDVALKLRTPEREAERPAVAWSELLAPQRTKRLLDAFAGDASLGWVAADGDARPPPNLQAHRALIVYLASRLGLPEPGSDEPATVNSPCWVRLEAIRPVLDGHLDAWEFETIPGRARGEFERALESTLLLAARHAGYRVTGMASVDAPFSSSFRTSNPSDLDH